MQTPLMYPDVDKELLALVPELRERYTSEARWQGDAGGKPGQYDMICFVLKPFLKEALTPSGDPAVLERIFNFLELMARTTDTQVVNLLYVGILEWLVSDPPKLTAAWKYMGDGTKKLAREAARIRRCEENLPNASRG